MYMYVWRERQYIVNVLVGVWMIWLVHELQLFNWPITPSHLIVNLAYAMIIHTLVVRSEPMFIH